jgi:redox-sensitive bicupin YhaK (pirin superfamily)
MTLKTTTAQMIKQVFPIDFHWPTIDPFLFCAYHKDSYPTGNQDLGPTGSLADRNLGMDFQIKDGFRMYHGTKIPGFPAHPHRGFETVTIVQTGLVDHADSIGAAGRYGNGDVQWMTAGKGIQHSEMFPLLQKSEPNPLELFQVWLNLPKASKFVDPHFTMFWGPQIPSVRQAGVSVKLIAGKIDTAKSLIPLKPPPHSWAASPDHQVAIWLITLEKDAQWTLPTAPKETGRSLYFYGGDSVRFGELTLGVNHGLILAAEMPLSLKNLGPTPASFVLLQGKPIGEPVAQHGPFVMNTKEEINTAILDYRKTQFGGWPWPRQDMVHDSGLKRFARFPDGKREEPKF